jgi:hypothetical protein
MATDSSPPRIRIILTIAFSSLVILVTLNYVFRSYFLMMTEEVEHAHLAKPEELLKLHEGEARNLTTAPTPIAQAMQELTTRGRTNYEALKAEADITPEPSTDMAPMVGWIRTPNQAVVDALTAAAANAPPAVDGGAATVAATGDAGATPAVVTPDAGPGAKHGAGPR